MLLLAPGWISVEMRMTISATNYLRSEGQMVGARTRNRRLHLLREANTADLAMPLSHVATTPVVSNKNLGT